MGGGDNFSDGGSQGGGPGEGRNLQGHLSV